MGKNTSQIKLSEGEAVKVIADLGRIIVSPGKIESHFAEETEKYDFKIFNFNKIIVTRNVLMLSGGIKYNEWHIGFIYTITIKNRIKHLILI